MDALLRELEGLVDTHGLDKVVATLSEICSGKADHLAENWQDENASEAWARNARKLDTLHGKLTPTV